MSKRRQFLDLRGTRFGRLIVVRKVGKLWLCRCKCGRSKQATTGNLRAGHITSCGCRQREMSAQRGREQLTTHGRAGTPEHAIWVQMRNRCRNPNSSSYPRYGGRGIKVCPRWDKFENFYADVGPRTSPAHTLDRIDNDGDYEPNNVRWSTSIEQGNNKRNSRFVVFRGRRMTVAEATHAAGDIVSVKHSHARLRRGWSIDRAVSEPLGRWGDSKSSFRPAASGLAHGPPMTMPAGRQPRISWV